MTTKTDANRAHRLSRTEMAEWLDSLEFVRREYGEEAAFQLLEALQSQAFRNGVRIPFAVHTPYVNTIPGEKQPAYPGDLELERRIASIIRWNAMAMVVRANAADSGIGGHISTYASSTTLIEVGMHHFFRGKDHESGGDFLYFQGHASPGMYARAFVEGRLSKKQLDGFRREVRNADGLSSYPHPRLMPTFWEHPTVSMGLGPIQAIYQARFNRYLHHRGLADDAGRMVWCFVGDGECDEPESVGALHLAATEKLDNLVFVVNCNLQRLDGPVRGNGKIIQELEGLFRGAGWNVVKVVWGGDWDPLLAEDEHGLLVKRMGDVNDGQFQLYTVETGAFIREDFFGASEELLQLVQHLSDDELAELNRGGHDPVKVFAAYQAAVEHQGAPTVVLAQTIKGYGMGEAGEGRTVTHQQKKLDEDELRQFRDRFGLPIADDQLNEIPYYRPEDDAPESEYLQQRRRELGGFLPERRVQVEPLEIPPLEEWKELLEGSDDKELATTMAFDRLLSLLLRDDDLGELVVPIIPDEARTFGMDALFQLCGIYSSEGQQYTPVDRESFLYYREEQDGQILEEGITEAGSMASFIAAGTAYATHGLNMIPFFAFYSMFGFQRVGDLIWAAADAMARGFLLGGTAGRTTLCGEGLQHQDGHSHLLASAVPNLHSYDPAFAYELAVVIHDGLERMYRDQEPIFYYLTMYNEKYPMPAMPKGAEEGILKGMYRFRSADAGDDPAVRPQLFGSGPLLREVLRAQSLLAEDFGVEADVWSVTSYNRLRRDALEAERWNLLHPDQPTKTCHLQQQLEPLRGPFIAVSDYMRMVPDQIARWIPGRYVPLGTDGFGRSDVRPTLRSHFEVDAEHIAYATLAALAAEERYDLESLLQARDALGVDPDAVNPAVI